MARTERLISNSLTLCVDLSELAYQSLETVDGCARLIRFRLHEGEPHFGDALLVLEQGEVLFHGLVRALDPDGWAMAMDPTSKLPVPAA